MARDIDKSFSCLFAKAENLSERLLKLRPRIRELFGRTDFLKDEVDKLHSELKELRQQMESQNKTSTRVNWVLLGILLALILTEYRY